jgi:hypothetical protein
MIRSVLGGRLADRELRVALAPDRGELLLEDGLQPPAAGGAHEHRAHAAAGALGRGRAPQEQELLVAHLV